MKVALGQTIGTPANVAANLALMNRLAVNAAMQGADILVLPELFLTGYNIGTAVQDLAETNGGPSSRAASMIAQSVGIAIVYGYPERAPEGVYNAALTIDRTGRIVANYRKTHLWGAEERTHFQAGKPAEPLSLCDMRFGFMICYDIDFPELARSQALAGVDAIISISATTVPYHVVPRHLIPARAYENQLFFIFANRAGAENGLRYVGESCIAAPDGSTVVRCGAGEELLLGTVDAAAYDGYRRAHLYKGERQPDPCR